MADETVPEHLIDIASDRFLKEGFTRVTTDEIAYSAGMSKKTLYKYFPGKKQLFSFIIGIFLRDMERKIDKILADPSLNSLEKIKEIFNAVGERASKLSKSLMVDFARSVPEEWRRIEEFRRRILLDIMKDLFLKAKAEGSIREDLDIELLVQVLFQIVTNTFVPEVLSEMPYQPVTIIETLINLVHRGSLTEEGRRKFGVFSATGTVGEKNP